MIVVVSARLQHLHQASAGGVVLPKNELVVSQVLSTLSKLLLPPRVMLQVLQLDLKVWWELLNQLVWSLLLWLLERFRIPVQRLTLTKNQILMGSLLGQQWLLALLVDEGMCVGCVTRDLPRLVNW